MIKTKENTIKQVSVEDKVIDTSHVKRIKQKPNEESDDGSRRAVNTVEHYRKGTAIESTRRVKKVVVRRSQSKEKAKMIKQRNGIPNDILSINEEHHSLSSLHHLAQNNKGESKNRILLSKTRKKDVSITPTNKQLIYMKQARALAISKHQKKVYQSSQEVGKIRKSVNTVSNFFSNTFITIKKATTSVTNLINMGIGLILIVFIVLFIGIFACLSDDSTVNSATEPISQEVMKYRDMITKYAKQYDMEEYVTLIQAIMMNESEGQGTDPMGASLLEYNTEYPKIENGIENAEYSIEVGVHYLSDCFELAEVKGPYDMNSISLMLQGYNYGKDYISWAKEYFDGYTRANAKVYSDEKKAELQVDTFGDPKYVSHVLRYYHLGNGDIVMVAKTQIGNIGGKPYWSWYGFNERVEWCACFVSWCANESGQLNVTIPKFSAVSDGINWYKDRGLFKTNDYIPKPGDLLFFDWENDGAPDHVGIVEKVENDYIYTIEGNSGDECHEKFYLIDSNVIYGYGERTIG